LGAPRLRGDKLSPMAWRCLFRTGTCQDLVLLRKFSEPRRAQSTRRQNARQEVERLGGFPEIRAGLPLVNPLFLRVLRGK
jgi:hypothetical protein